MFFLFCPLVFRTANQNHSTDQNKTFYHSYDKTKTATDPMLVKLYGEKMVSENSAADLAVHQMRESGVIVVDKIVFEGE